MFCFYEWNVFADYDRHQNLRTGLFLDLRKWNVASLIFGKICCVSCAINCTGKLICQHVCPHMHDCMSLIDKPATVIQT